MSVDALVFFAGGGVEPVKSQTTLKNRKNGILPTRILGREPSLGPPVVPFTLFWGKVPLLK